MRRVLFMWLATTLALVAGGSVSASSPSTTRASVASDGTQANFHSGFDAYGATAISADGRFVAFASLATNIVPNDANTCIDPTFDPTTCGLDVFVHDNFEGTTERVSVDDAGNQADDMSGVTGVSISGNGRYVAFASYATNLVSNDTNGPRVPDVFVRDRTLGTTERVSIGTDGSEGNDYSDFVSINADGRYVAFQSGASNLVSNDLNRTGDVFVRDRLMGTTERVSVDSSGAEADMGGGKPTISADGRFVAFDSGSTNLVPGDTNDLEDVFVHDRQSGATERVSVNSAGNQANGASDTGVISADGQIVAFDSWASNLDTMADSHLGVFARVRTLDTTQRIGFNAAPSRALSLSANGCFVTWRPAGGRILVYNRASGTTNQVDLDNSGNSPSDTDRDTGPSISANGQFVAFVSGSSHLVSGDTNDMWDIFIRDRGTDAVIPWPVPAGDSDCDGFPDSVAVSQRASEAFMGTDAAGHCAADNIQDNEPLPDRWPVDFNDDQLVSGGDFLAFAPVFGRISPDPVYTANVRFNLNGDDRISGGDFLVFAPFYGKKCA